MFTYQADLLPSLSVLVEQVAYHLMVVAHLESLHLSLRFTARVVAVAEPDLMLASSTWVKTVAQAAAALSVVLSVTELAALEITAVLVLLVVMVLAAVAVLVLLEVQKFLTLAVLVEQDLQTR